MALLLSLPVSGDIAIHTTGRRGRDCLVVGFTATYAISAYHHWCCQLESRSGRGVQHHAIKFVSDLRKVGGFLGFLRFPPSIKTDRHDITEMLLKVALNTIKQTAINTTATKRSRYWSYHCWKRSLHNCMNSNIHGWKVKLHGRVMEVNILQFTHQK
jgi:hypothetical protein